MDDNVLAASGGIEHWLTSRNEPVLLIDAGGVLFNNVIEDSAFIEDVARTLGVSASQLLVAYAAEDHLFETNRVDVHDVLAGCLQQLGCRALGASDFARIDRLYAMSIVPNVHMFAALKNVRGRGHTLVLANNEAERWDAIKHEMFGYFDLFDHHASSWKVRACKPTATYFERLDGLLHPHPRSQWHLLDDNVNVVAQARALNVPATRYGGGLHSHVRPDSRVADVRRACSEPDVLK
jgi:putative hydrolase of the HAD superfamily